MQRLVGAALGTLFGGAVGAAMGGQALMVITASVGSLGGFLLVAHFMPPLPRRD